MLASGVVLGVVAGRLLGGRFARLADLSIEWWPALIAAVAIRVVAPAYGESVPVWVVAFGLIVAVAIINLRIGGMWLIALGAALNLLVVVANGAMPVDGGALALASARLPVDGLHRELAPTDLLPLLADRIPLPPLAGVYSAGDLLLFVGGSWVPFAWMRRE